jgi:hypothetical protein
MTRPPARASVEPGRRLITTTKPTTDLAPGDSIRLPGSGSYPIAAPPLHIPQTTRGALVVVALAWSPLAILAAPTDAWEATSLDPPIYQRASCPACAGSGRCPDPWNWRTPRRTASGERDRRERAA